MSIKVELRSAHGLRATDHCTLPKCWSGAYTLLIELRQIAKTATEVLVAFDIALDGHRYGKRLDVIVEFKGGGSGDQAGHTLSNSAALNRNQRAGEFIHLPARSGFSALGPAPREPQGRKAAQQIADGGRFWNRRRWGDRDLARTATTVNGIDIESERVALVYPK